MVSSVKELTYRVSLASKKKKGLISEYVLEYGCSTHTEHLDACTFSIIEEESPLQRGTVS